METTRRRTVALLLSLPAPGLGHLYAGRPLLAIGWFIAVKGSEALISLSVLARWPVAAIWTFFALAGLAPLLHAARTAGRAPAGYILRPYNRWWIYLALAVGHLAVWGPASKALYSRYLLKAYRNPSPGMAPTLLVGDYLWVDRRASARTRPRINDVLAFASVEVPDLTLVKRVVGISGDTIGMMDGTLVRNGVLVSEPWVRHMAPTDTLRNWGPVVVPPRTIFVLGDNRSESYDSRYFGGVPVANIEGRPVSIYFSWDAEAGATRWDRIGTSPWEARTEEQLFLSSHTPERSR